MEENKEVEAKVKTQDKDPAAAIEVVDLADLEKVLGGAGPSTGGPVGSGGGDVSYDTTMCPW